MRIAPRARRPLIGATIIAVVVLGFTRGWRGGHTTLDGNGVVLYVDIALHYWRSSGHVPYWIPDVWTGTPVWALAPIFPVLTLLPLARLLGPEPAVRAMTVLLQIVGGWGAMTLAASLWQEERRLGGGRRLAVDAVGVAAVVAGCLYALNPIVISHGTLFGHETTIAVLAVAPWLVWALRRGLRGDGAGWIVLAGAFAAFAILDQAEHAYALVIICALVAVGQVAVAVRAAGAAAIRPIALRAVAVVGIITGLLAHWLLPLKALSNSFILSPPDVVSASLTNGIGAQLANEPGAFVTRSPGLARVVTYQHPDLLRSGSFYLGWVWLLGTAVALVVLALRPRRDRDGTLCALLLAAALSIWMSTAATPLARSGPGLRHQWFALAVIGVLGGLCIGAYFRRLAAGRVAIGLGLGAVVLLFAVPYLTPFLVLQRLIPLAGNLRLPRLYPVAVLGLSLGAAYPITLIERIARRPPSAPNGRVALQRIRIVQLGAIAAGVGLLAVAIVDVWPYHDFYRTRPPADSAAYATALAAAPANGRLITEQFGDPRIIEDLYRSGRPLATGWPHPIAARQVWPVAVTPQEAAPSGYRDTAAALAGATALITEHDPLPPLPRTAAEFAALARRADDPHNPAADLPANSVEVDSIGAALPIVRAYDHAVVVGPSAPVTELGVGLLPDHISVVSGGAAARALVSVVSGGAPEDASCASYGAEAATGTLGNELPIACALHRWVGRYNGLNQTLLGPGVGALFTAGEGMTGLALWLLGPTTGVQLEVRPQRADGSLGAPLVVTGPGHLDRDGLTPFRFPALPPGRYGFEATCPSCTSAVDTSARIVFTEASPGNLIVADRLVTDLVAAYAPIYSRLAPEPASTAALTTTRHTPGQWDVTVHADRPQLVVVAEADFRGWRASVDGRAAPVLNADVAFVGVPVPAGTHTLKLRYRAPGVTPGDWISGLTVLVCAAVVVRPRVWPRIRGALRTGRLGRAAATDP